MNHRMLPGVAITLIGMYIVPGCNDDVTAPTVTPPAVGSIVLELEADTLSVRQTTQLHAIVLSVSGDTLAGEAVTFESGDEDIVTISDTGLVKAIGPGRAVITARTDDHSATITIYVRRAAAASISVAPSDTTLFVGDRLRLAAMVLDADGAPIADAVVSWIGEVGVHAVAPLDDAGAEAKFIAQALGNEVITAKTEGLTATVDVTVVPSHVVRVVLLPDTLTIPVRGSGQVIARVWDETGTEIQWAPGDIRFFCGGDFIFSPPDRCASADQTFATITNTGFITHVFGRPQGPQPVIARYQGVWSNRIWLSITAG